MKVLHGIVSLRPEDGGPARSVPALANAVAETGVETVVCSQSEPKIDLAPYGSVTFRSGNIVDIAAEFRPDVIHDHGIWLPCNHRAAVAARRNSALYVVSTRGMLEPWCLSHHPIRKRIAWFLYQKRNLRDAALFHATSHAEATTIRRLGFEQPMAVLPNGVTPPVVLPAGQLAENKRTLVFIGRIHPVKGLESLLSAWAELGPADWNLKLFGPVEDGHDVEIDRVIQDRNLTGVVERRASLSTEEKWAVLRSADAVVLPSYSENFGIVVAEALLMGTPVLTTTGTPWKGLTERGCGWWEEPGHDGILNGLRRLTSTSCDKLRQMGEEGQRWMEADFLWREIGVSMGRCYEWLLHGHERPTHIIKGGAEL